MNDFEKLLKSTFPFVEELLIKYGEFYPLASAIKINDIIAQVGTFDGNDNPLSNSVILNLKNALRAKREDYKSIAIFYDVKVMDPNTNLKTDAVAVYVESKIENIAYVFYYPYELSSDKQLKFFDSWKESNDLEIFKN